MSPTYAEFDRDLPQAFTVEPHSDRLLFAVRSHLFCFHVSHSDIRSDSASRQKSPASPKRAGRVLSVRRSELLFLLFCASFTTYARDFPSLLCVKLLRSCCTSLLVRLACALR